MQQDLIGLLLERTGQTPESAPGTAILGRIGRAGALYLDVSTRVAAEFGLTVGEAFSLEYILNAGSEGDITLGELASATAASTSAATRRVDALELKGLVRRIPDAKDKRLVLLVHTDEGRELAERLRSVQQERQAQFLDPFTAHEAAQFAELLRKLLLELEARGSTRRNDAPSSK